MKLMGSRFDITVVANNPKAATHYIQLAVDEITRIENLISSWDKNSETYEINKNTSINPVKVSPELFELNKRPIVISKLTDIGYKYTLYPNYRYYNQTAANYFAPFDELLSTSTFYTSDFDLSKFNANQFGLGLKYTDILTEGHIWKFGLKSVTLNYSYYQRNIGFKAHIVSLGAKINLDQ